MEPGWSVPPADQDVGSSSLDTARPWWTRRALRWAALVLLVAGSAVGGAAVGWWARDAQGDALAPLEIDALIDRPVVLAGPPNAGVGQMPSLLGLPLDQSRRILFDAGVPSNSITVIQRPSALENGLVIVQQPSPGSALSDAVELAVSAPALVPELVGLPLDEAQELLEGLGAVPSVQHGSDSGVGPGIVLRSTPSAGETLERQIVLEVSSS